MTKHEKTNIVNPFKVNYLAPPNKSHLKGVNMSAFQVIPKIFKYKILYFLLYKYINTIFTNKQVKKYSIYKFKIMGEIL